MHDVADPVAQREVGVAGHRSPMRRGRPVAALAVVLALGVAACGGENGNSDQGGAPAGQPAAQATQLEATEFAFDPSQVTVAPGEHEFEIVNRGEVEHALEIHTPDGEVETDRVGAGDSATVTANLSEPGSYEFYCPVANHRELGMEGTVKVEEGAGGGADAGQGEGDDASSGAADGGY